MKFFLLFLVITLLTKNGHSKMLNSCVCGQESDEGLIIIRTSGSRIVNGTEVKPHKYPWMAVMMKRWSNVCGGSIISDRNILTAGHCVFYIPSPKRTRWIVGSHNIKQSKIDFRNSYKTADFMLHPYFKSGEMFDKFDVSIITLDRPIRFRSTIKPICLPNVGDDVYFWNHKVIVAGWGRISETGPPSNVLQETKVWLKTPQQCEILTQGIEYDTKSMICAHEKSTDACQGDSGGPIFGDKSINHNVILGVVSFGDGCARDFPGVYSKITEEVTLNWIANVISASNGNVCMDPEAEMNY